MFLDPLSATLRRIVLGCATSAVMRRSEEAADRALRMRESAAGQDRVPMGIRRG